jgi:hypothetical protein
LIGVCSLKFCFIFTCVSAAAEEEEEGRKEGRKGEEEECVIFGVWVDQATDTGVCCKSASAVRAVWGVRSRGETIADMANCCSFRGFFSPCVFLPLVSRSAAHCLWCRLGSHS